MRKFFNKLTNLFSPFLSCLCRCLKNIDKKCKEESLRVVRIAKMEHQELEKKRTITCYSKLVQVFKALRTKKINFT